MKDKPRATITLKKPKRRKINPEQSDAPAQQKHQAKQPEPEPATKNSKPPKKSREGGEDSPRKDPTKAEAKKIREQEIKRLNDHLWNRPVWREYKPLAIGIIQDVMEEADKIGVSRKLARMLMRRHTLFWKYLENLANNTESISRYDLDGNPSGFVLPEARYAALARLEKRLNRKHTREEMEGIKKPEPPQMSLF